MSLFIGFLNDNNWNIVLNNRMAHLPYMSHPDLEGFKDVIDSL